MRAPDYLRLPGSKNIWRVGGFGLSTSPGTKSTLRTFEEVREARNEESQVASAVSAKFTMTKSAAARAFNLGVTMVITIFSSFLLLVLLMVISLIIGAQSQSGEPFMLFFTMFPILWLLIAGLGVTAVVFHIIGAVKANSGEDYKYPLPTIPMLH